MMNNKEVIRTVLKARYGDFGDDRFVALIDSLSRSDNIAKTLSEFGWDPLAVYPLVKDIEGALQLPVDKK